MVDQNGLVTPTGAGVVTIYATAKNGVTAALTLRGTLGVLGVFSVLALCLAPLLHLAVQYLFYQLAAFFSAVTGADPLCKFLEQLSSAFSLMLAMTAGGAFLLLVSFLIAMMMVVTV